MEDAADISPDGRRLAEYLPETEQGLVMAELDFTGITMAKAVADPAGHYSKPESTRLLLNRQPQTPVMEEADRVADSAGWTQVDAARTPGFEAGDD